MIHRAVVIGIGIAMLSMIILGSILAYSLYFNYSAIECTTDQCLYERFVACKPAHGIARLNPFSDTTATIPPIYFDGHVIESIPKVQETSNPTADVTIKGVQNDDCLVEVRTSARSLTCTFPISVINTVSENSEEDDQDDQLFRNLIQRCSSNE